MCKWCADQAIPSHKNDHTRPAAGMHNCPVCRKRVRQKARIFGGDPVEKAPKPPESEANDQNTLSSQEPRVEEMVAQST
jgi:hypothetical protein